MSKVKYIRNEVLEGVRLLDELLPGKWYSMIDLTKLDMNNGERCILGQLEPHLPVVNDSDEVQSQLEEYKGEDPYDRALIKLDLDWMDDEVLHGFNSRARDFDELTQEWIEVINERLNVG